MLLYVEKFETLGNMSMSNNTTASISQYMPELAISGGYGTGTGVNVIELTTGVTSPRRVLLQVENGTFKSYANISIPMPVPKTGKVWVYGLFATREAINPTLASVGIIDVRAPVANGTSTTARLDCLYVNLDGSLTINGESSAAGIFQFDVQTHIQVECDIPGQVINIYANDELVVTAATTLTEITSVNYCIAKTVQTTATTHQVFIDDMAINDDSGTKNNTRLGPVKSVNVPPSSSVLSMFTPVGAANNLAAINKTSLSTTTYNQSSLVNGEEDSYMMNVTGLDPAHDILGVQVCTYHRKTDMTPRNLEVRISDGTNNLDYTADPHTDTYGGSIQHIEESAPDGTDWDTTKLGACTMSYITRQ